MNRSMNFFTSFLLILRYFNFICISIEGKYKSVENNNDLISFIDPCKFDINESHGRLLSFLRRNRNYCLRNNVNSKLIKVKSLTDQIIFFKEFFFLTLTKILFMSSLNLETLPSGFETFKCLEELELANNKFKAIPDVIYKLETLKKLTLENNFITVLPDDIAKLVKLKDLSIASNQITFLSPRLKELSRLKSINFHSINKNNTENHISSNVNFFFLMPKKVSLIDLDANNIKRISGLGRFKKLTVLYLRSNKLKKLPKSITKLKELATLFLCKNEFVTFPYVLSSLNKLWCLTLNDNKLQNLLFTGDQFKSLNGLQLDNNNIKTFVVKDNALKSLCGLSLENNELLYFCKDGYFEEDNIDEIQFFKSLLSLRITFKSLKYIKSISKLANLEVLNIKVKKIIPLSKERCDNLFCCFSDFKRLTFLKLENIGLRQFPQVLTKLETLHILDLSFNFISVIGDEIFGLKTRILNLEANYITSLPVNLFTETRTEEIILNGNKITYLPHLLKNHIEQPRIQLKDIKLNCYGNNDQIGAYNIPPEYIDKIQLTVLGEEPNHVQRFDYSLKHENTIIWWNTEIFAQLKTLEIPQHTLRFEELTEIIESLICDMEEEFKITFMTYFKIIYQQERSPNISNLFGTDYRNVLKDHFEYIIFLIKNLKDNGYDSATKMLKWMSYCFESCYDGQIEHYITMIHQLTKINYNDVHIIIINYFIELKYDMLKYITTSNTDPENIYILIHWEIQLAEMLGFNRTNNLYDCEIPFILCESRNYILYQFYKNFTVDYVAEKVTTFINANNDYVSRFSELLYALSSMSLTKYAEYVVYEGDISELRITGIKELGVLEFFKAVDIVNITQRQQE
ncbi:Leucine rich repeat protein [Spraguea lophii 42_110]|uniref:Leucine rich repeat protein n=1 Tax=Spraguea lophii (strain 42_110) TaxID=1358809 RepID=S7WA88_SPRLO|nr:Leucine rich repeat protein [Spraguea lophii 42_110]